MVAARCLVVASVLLVGGGASLAAAQQAPAHATPSPAAPPPQRLPADCTKVDDGKADSPAHAATPADPRTARLCRFIEKQAYRIGLLERKIALLQKP